MKRCSTCNRTYTDPNLSFCTEDGTPLTPITEDESTVVSPTARVTAGNDDWNRAPYQPPGPYVPPGTQGRRRRVWPWVLGILGAFLLGIVAISIVAAFLMRSRRNEPAIRTIEPANTNTAVPENSNSETANANVAVTVPPPTNHDDVLEQLTDLENEWTAANFKADKQALDRILADDYVGHPPEGGILSKADYIRTIRPNDEVEKWDLDDLKLNLIGDRATLSGKIKFEIRDADDQKFEFLDKFVWRDGRWQATGSEIKPRD
jgi:hypothetical protein